jgi:hypothetical protein
MIQNRNLQWDIVGVLPELSTNSKELHRNLQLDIVWILNLSPMARFLGEPYKYSSTSNSSHVLATTFSY